MIPYLGELAAEDRLERHTLLDQTFVKTSSVELALRDNTVFVCGRKGAGKTAVIHYLEHDYHVDGRLTTSLKHKDYEALQVNLAIDIVDKLLVGTNGYNALIITYKRIWQYLLDAQMLFALNAAVKSGFIPGPLDDISNFVSATARASAVLHVEEKVHSLLVRHSESSLSKTDFHRVIGLCMDDPAFRKAKQQALGVLDNVSFMLLIDTMEQYNIADAGLYPFQGLCEAVLDFHNEYAHQRVSIKCFLPAEMTEHLFGQTRAKFLQHAAYLNWSYSELIRLVGSRFAYYLKTRVKDSQALDKAKELEERIKTLEDTEGPRNRLARNLVWLCFAPPKITNRLGQREDSCAYLIRHTQKRPREVLCSMNHILMQANANSMSPTVTAIQEKDIVGGLHSSENLHSLINDTLAAFAVPFQREKAADVIARIMNNEPRIFPHSRLRRIIKRAFANQEFLDQDRARMTDKKSLVTELRRMLFRSGLIGEVDHESIHVLDAATNQTLRYYCTRFEYVRPGLLEPNELSTCAMHPMLADYVHAPDTNSPKGIVYHLPEEEDVQEGIA